MFTSATPDGITPEPGSGSGPVPVLGIRGQVFWCGDAGPGVFWCGDAERKACGAAIRTEMPVEAARHGYPALVAATIT
jgi:hypothetical protein